MKTLQDIAAEVPGYHPDNLGTDAVHDFLARLAQPVTGTETVGVFDALDRVLAEDVVSPLDVPPHDNSAMDGYAFNGSALMGDQALTLHPVEGTAFAGQAWATPVPPGHCLRIMTGAVLPPGVDTVVPLELTQNTADGAITVPAGAVARGANRRLRGEDLQRGGTALRAGDRLGPAALGLIASLGLPTVTVTRRLRVAYFSTGDEILSLGEAPREGAVYDSNRYTVFGLLRRLGAEVIDLGVVKDDPAAIEAAFLQAGAHADAVITSGGVSAGDADHTRALMQRLGNVVFWRVAMRPGRPMAVGCLQTGALLFGLPGNPVATMVSFLAFVRPALLRMMGVSNPTPLLIPARCQETLHKKPGRTEYQRGIVSRAADGSLQVRTTGNQGSGVLSSMHEANALIVLHHAQGTVAVGDRVDVMPFFGTV